MPVYGFEFIGESWKHNLIFGWNLWIVLSCACLVVALDIYDQAQEWLGSHWTCKNENACLGENRKQDVSVRMIVNVVAMLYFNFCKLISLAMGLCDIE